MKIALVHDSLVQFGGAERVLEVLCEMFPEAPIYTLLYDPKKMGGKFADHKIITSFLDFPFVRQHYLWFFWLMPVAARMVKVSSKYSLVLCDSAYYGRGVRAHRDAQHILYCYTPVRYALNKDVMNLGLESFGVPYLFRKAMFGIL